MSVADELIQGSIDIHVHFAPDPKIERRADAIETAQRAQELGMRALVLKSHEYPTMPVAYTVQKLVPEMSILGGIALDYEVGGVNPVAVEASAQMGAKVVWMPTFSAAADYQRKGLEGGISIINEEGRLTPETVEVLEVVRSHDLVVGTGHLSTRESMALVEGARDMGIQRIVITHASIMNRWVGMSVEEMKALADRGAFLEHCILAMMPGRFDISPQELVGMIQAVGAEHCILSSDLGQWYNPIAPEGFRAALGTLHQAGLSQGELEIMASRNPARILGLE